MEGQAVLGRGRDKGRKPRGTGAGGVRERELPEARLVIRADKSDFLE